MRLSRTARPFVTGVALLGVLVLLAASCGEQETAAPAEPAPAEPAPAEPAPPETGAPETTAATEPPAATGEPVLLPVGEEALPAGVYATSVFQPGFTVEVGDGWTFTGESEGLLTLDRRPAEGEPDFDYDYDQVPQLSFVVLSDSVQVFDPAVDPTDPVLDPLADLPDDLVAWLGENPRLESEPAAPAPVGGTEGTGIDSTPLDPATMDRCDDIACVPILHVTLPIGDAVHTLNEGNRQRVIELAVDGQRLAVIAEATADEFDAFMGEVEGVLSSIELTDGGGGGSAAGETLYLDPGPLQAGVYETPGYLSVRLTLPEGWETSGSQNSWFDLFEQGAEETGTIAVWAPDVVFDPATKGEALQTTPPATAPDDMLAWLREHPGLEVTGGPEPVSLGGLSGQQLEAVTKAGNDWPDCPPGKSCLALAPLPLGGAFGTYEGDLVRAYVLDGSESQVVVLVTATEAEFEQFLEKAEPILETFEFEPES
jgi:hypothetical protein